jgi:hypothetical protein
VWSALGGELKPSLDIVVVVPMEIHRVTQAAPPVLDELLTVSASGVREGKRRKGRTDGVDGLDAVPEEIAGLAHRVGPREKVQAGSPTGPRPAVSPEEPAVQDDVVVSGREPRPGRIVRVRGVERP